MAIADAFLIGGLAVLTDKTTAVVFREPGKLAVQRVGLKPLGSDDCLVETEWSGISTGTERLLWTGRMPDFPGMGYPLVPGYESVARVVEAGADSQLKVGDRVFVPGAQCFNEVRGLFGGAASHLVVPSNRMVKLDDELGAEGTLMALSATAYHALQLIPDQLPDLIVGHGVLGRLIARLVVALGGEKPTVWERNSERRQGEYGYRLVDPEADECHDYRLICDVSGDHGLLDSLIGRLARGGSIVLAGFYDQSLHFQFPAAFMREARILISAEWQPSDLAAAMALLQANKFNLDGLITHRSCLSNAGEAYETAFSDAECLKMIIDWRH